VTIAFRADTRLGLECLLECLRERHTFTRSPHPSQACLAQSSPWKEARSAPAMITIADVATTISALRADEGSGSRPVIAGEHFEWQIQRGRW
jgi:hypothetical protein